MFLGARCIVIVLWLVASGLNGVVARRFHVTSVDEHLGSERVLWAVSGFFQGLASQARHARRRAAERCNSASESLDRGDCFSACVGCGRATVDTDRSSASGVVVAPRKQSGLSSGRWEFSSLCGRRPVCARPAGAELEGSVVWRVGGCGVGLVCTRRTQAQNCLPWSTKEKIPRSEAPRRSRWQLGTSSS